MLSYLKYPDVYFPLNTLYRYIGFMLSRSEQHCTWYLKHKIYRKNNVIHKIIFCGLKLSMHTYICWVFFSHGQPCWLLFFWNQITKNIFSYTYWNRWDILVIIEECLIQNYILSIVRQKMAWKNAICYRSNISSNVSLKFSSLSLSDISNCLSLLVKSFYCLVIPSFSITSFGKKNIFIYLSCRRLPKNFSYELGSGNCDYANCDWLMTFDGIFMATI